MIELMPINEMGLYKAWKRMPEMHHEFRWKRTVVVDTAAQRRKVLGAFPIKEMGVYKIWARLAGERSQYDKQRNGSKRREIALKTIEMQSGGMSVIEISKKTGIKVSTLYHYVSEFKMGKI